MSPVALKRRRMSSSSESTISHRPRPIRPLPKRRQQVSSALKIRPSLLLHRSSSPIFSETETDTPDTSSTELGTALSDVESEVQALRRWEDSPELMDGDEVEHVLIHIGASSNTGGKGDDSDAWSGPDSPLPWRGLEKGKSIDPTEYGVARVLFPLEKALSHAPDKSMDIDSPEGIRVGKGKQRQSSALVTPPPKRTREWESELHMSDDDGDDELEVDELADAMPVRRASRKRAKLGTPIALRSQPPTPSILNITNRIDNLAAGSMSAIADAAMSDEEDDARVHASLVPSSPPPPPTSRMKRSKNAKKACLTTRRHARQRAGPSRLTAAPCANSSRSFASHSGQRSCSSAMDISDPESLIVRRIEFRDTAVQRRPKHHAAPVRLPGQLSTSNLHRYSPTSLLPLREKGIRRRSFPQFAKPSREARYLFGDRSNVHCDVILGQAVLAALHVARREKRERNALVRRHNLKHADGPWRAGVGQWFAYDVVARYVSQMYLKFGLIVPPEDEASVEQVLDCESCSHSANTRGSSASTNALAERSAESNVGEVGPSSRQDASCCSPMKRSGSHLANAHVEVISERWGRRNQLRLREETASHRAAMRDRQTARRQRAAAVAAQERFDESERRHAAAATRREEEERLMREEAESQARLLAAEAVQNVESITAAVEEVETHTDVEEDMPTASESGSPLRGDTSSRSDHAIDEAQLLGSPPSYVSPPEQSVRHQSFRPQRSPSPPAVPLSPPRYRRNLAYSRRSPTPPPPYNATSDRQTLVAARFVQFSSDEEGDEESLPPTPTPPARVYSRPTLPRTRMVGAFPSATSALPEADAPPTRSIHDVGRIIAPIPIRRSGMSGSLQETVSAFEAAVDIEDGSVWQSDFESDDERAENAAIAFDEPSREDEEGGYAALGRLRRWFGRWMG